MRSYFVRVGLAAICGTALFAADTAAKNEKAETPVYRSGSGSKSRVHLGGIMVSAGYTHFHGYPWGYPYAYYPYSFYGAGWGYGPYLSTWYSPFWYAPMYGPWVYPGLYDGYAFQPGMGELKLPTKSKAASVFIDGAFAGTADKLKHVWLEPGAYNIELRESNQPPMKERVYVLSGKTVTLQAGKRE